LEDAALVCKSQYNGSFLIEIAMDGSSKMDKPRPYVTAALLCEKVIEEKDGSLTIIRIADRLQYRLDAINLPGGFPQDVRPAVTIQGLVSLKSGLVTGDHVTTVILEKPNGTRKEIINFPFKFLGKDQGQNLIMNINLGVDEDGLYWFDVHFDGELLTRIPLLIMPLQEQPKIQTAG
jgi:hypothetical protein